MARKQLLADMAEAIVRENGDFLEIYMGNYERPEYVDITTCLLKES